MPCASVTFHLTLTHRHTRTPTKSGLFPVNLPTGILIASETVGVRGMFITNVWEEGPGELPAAPKPVPGRAALCPGEATEDTTGI